MSRARNLQKKREQIVFRLSTADNGSVFEKHFLIISFLIVAELIAYVVLKKNFYSFGQAVSSLSIDYFGAFLRNLLNGLILFIWPILSSATIFNFDSSYWLYYPALLASVELVYYWDHRLKHRLRWMWASHKPHHSITEMNVPNGLVPSLTSTLSGTFLLYIPLVVVGFKVQDVFWMSSLIIYFQVFLHNEIIGKLPILDSVFNTPANHRMHHDLAFGKRSCNFGGMSVVYDKIFGTYESETSRDHVYGIANEKPSLNPFNTVFSEWVAIFADLRKARRLRDFKKALIG